ncbi:DNA-directed RNA polymerase II subunit rpb1-like [Spodoptera litura]|uniref:DNA-directed RNA polymerase II subunit rpb1-like n=1 Tax=Spodoptera litura TaxID=69820 RepID=A0A9J7EMN0_SPOLT|nr:DNA-directed RNA polymerase II subunit rpb1-like [Spodoptera litura]
MRALLAISLCLVCFTDQSYATFADFMNNLPSEIATAFSSAWDSITDVIKKPVRIKRLGHGGKHKTYTTTTDEPINRHKRIMMRRAKTTPDFGHFEYSEATTVGLKVTLPLLLAPSFKNYNEWSDMQRAYFTRHNHIRRLKVENKNSIEEDVLNWTPDSPTWAPDDPTWAPDDRTWVPDDPTWAPDGPTWAPDGPTWEPDGPTWALDVPTWEPDVPTWEPDVSTWAPDVSTWAPDVSTWEPDILTWEPHVSTRTPDDDDDDDDKTAYDYTKEEKRKIHYLLYSMAKKRFSKLKKLHPRKNEPTLGLCKFLSRLYTSKYDHYSQNRRGDTAY